MKREIALQRDWGAIFFAKYCIYAFFFVPSNICLGLPLFRPFIQSQFPRSYCHPMQPMLQVRSHFFIRKPATPVVQLSSSLLRASSHSGIKIVQNRLTIYCFLIKKCSVLAYVHFFLYLCTEINITQKYESTSSNRETIC